jgi:uncharacterized damage-inducible protein DinB
MTAVELLRQECAMAWDELRESLEGVGQAQAWAVLPQGGPDYLHSDGSIHGIALHVATCKFAYASIGFRNAEVRWRDLAERVGAFEPDWKAARAFLDEAHAYWEASWRDWDDEDLEREVPHFSGKTWPAWKIVRMMTFHDGYHAGQIAMLRYAVGESSAPPPSVAEDICTHCASLPNR